MIIANWKSNIVDINQWTHDFHDEYIVNVRLQSTIFGVAPPSIYIQKIKSTNKDLYFCNSIDVYMVSF